MTKPLFLLAAKFMTLADDLEAQYGRFDLFAMFMRDTSLERWDIVVAASWLPDRTLETIRKIVTPMQERLTVSELVEEVSHVSIVQPYEEEVLAIQQEFGSAPKPVMLYRRDFFGKELRRGIIIKSPLPAEMHTLIAPKVGM